MNDYKETQIIKHALEYYSKRPGATEKERAQEKRLFHKFSEKANAYKNRFGMEEGRRKNVRNKGNKG